MYVQWIRSLVHEIMEEDPAPYTPFIGTLILFIGLSNLLAAIPVIRSPTTLVAARVTGPGAANVARAASIAALSASTCSDVSSGLASR